MAHESRIVIFAALIGNGVIAVAKFIAAALSGSAAMLAEGIHSVVDTGNQGLMLLGLARGQRPPDERFPFGHGKEVYFWAFVVALSIFAVGAGISLYEGVRHLIHPEPLGDPSLSYAVLAIAIVAESVAWWYAWRAFRKAKGAMGAVQAVREAKDPTLFVVLLEDSAALLGLLVALGGITMAQATGNPVYDAAATVGIGLILGGVAAWLAVETQSLLIGEAAHPGIRAVIRKLARETPGVQRISELVTLHMGPRSVIVTLSVDFQDDLSAEQAEEAVTHINRAIKEHFPEVKRVFVEVESWPHHRAQVAADGASGS